MAGPRCGPALALRLGLDYVGTRSCSLFDLLPHFNLVWVLHYIIPSLTCPVRHRGPTSVWFQYISKGWCVCRHQDILAYNCEESDCCSLPFPIIADCKRELAVALGMLDPDEKDKDGMPLTARCVSLPPPHPPILRAAFKLISTPCAFACRCSSLALTKG